MISRDEIDRTIIELEERDTSFAVCEKLALLYIVRDHIGKTQENQPRSTDDRLDIGAAQTGDNTIKTDGDTEFLAAVNGKDAEKVWRIIGKTMGVIQSLHPKMYQHLMDDINNL